MNWDLARSMATRFAGSYPLEGTYHESRLAEQAPGLVARASALVEEETGLHASGAPEVSVVSRRKWAEANISSFSILMGPVEERLSRHRGIGRNVAGRVMATELGAVLGLLSRRVLGQYELVLPTSSGGTGDTMMFVGGNVLAIERQQEFNPDEFRFWVALHECTHRLQFMAVPWMRGYFLGLVDELMASAKPEKDRVSRMTTEIRAASAEGRPLMDEKGLFGLLASPEQREVIDRVQALMSLLEGHGHVVMDRVGARELLTQARMSRLLKARRQDPRTMMLMRAIGLEMKIRQYELGAEFVAGVEHHAGWAALDAAWERPENLPTLAEIENPVLWLERVA